MADSHTHHPAPTDVAPPNSHGAEHDAAHVDKHIKWYWFIGVTLMVFTGITVALSYVNFGSSKWNIIVAMIVATFKAGLVAAIFMHLKGERITVWRFLFFTAFFVFGLFMLTLLHATDPIPGTGHNAH